MIICLIWPGNASESIAVENDFWNTLLSLLAPWLKMMDGWMDGCRGIFFPQIVNVVTNLKLHHDDFLKLNKYFLVPKSNFYARVRANEKTKKQRKHTKIQQG